MNTLVCQDERLNTRIGFALADTWTMTVRELQHWRNKPGVVIFNWLFPVMIMAMFVGFFGGAISTATDASYVDFVMPGVFAMTVLFGLEGTMAAVSSDATKGVMNRFRSLPTSGFAVVAGRCLADLLNSIVGLSVVVAAGIAFGWRPHTGIASIMAAFGVLLLLRIAMLWVGVFIGLKATSPETVTAVQVLVWPLLFVSTVFIDTATMPRWLGVVAEANPLSATASATRDLLGNPGLAGQSWFADNAIALAVVCPMVLTAVFLPASVRMYRTLSRR